eukprot:9765612-Alexandrium_andersonii.AAC.1
MDDGDDDVPMDSAPKRGRFGGKRPIPRRPKPPPSGPAAEEKPGEHSAAGAAAKNPRAEPTDVDFAGVRCK